jgi:hypothetical protein
MVYRPHLKNIEESYTLVLKNWQNIDDELDTLKIGRKDTPFNEKLMENMLLAWEYVDFILKHSRHQLFSGKGGPELLEINNRVHYGTDLQLREEYRKAIEANTVKFSENIVPIRKYYRKHMKQRTSVYHIAAEIYIAILGIPQLYIEGNHRSGSIAASCINLENNKPPFVLTVENAISFFRPAQEIKKFNKRSVWRSLTKLPKYKSDFKKFWKNHCDMQFARD